MDGGDDFDLYDTLNLQRDASVDDVRAAFRDLSRVYHPDKSGGSEGNAGGEQAFMRVHRAYRVLGDEVLRSFYDRYGLSGVCLAETLTDDGGREGAGSLGVPDDRLKDLEGRVQQLMRKREELKVQRLLGLQGSFTLSMAAAPGSLGAHFRRQYRLQYSAVSQSVQVVTSERIKFTAGCASHVQGANGVGVAKLMLAATSQLNPATSTRVAANITGTAPELQVGVMRSLTPDCTVQQKVSVSGDSASMSLTFHPWLSRTLRASLGFTCGDERGLSMGLVQRSMSNGCSGRLFLDLQREGAGDLGVQLKYKPSQDFSLKLAPSISARGWTLQAICTKAAADGLTKVHWALRVRRRGALLKLTLCRSGLRFALPLELWPESAGSLPPSELGLLLLLWAAPPLVVRLLRAFAQASWAAARCCWPGAAAAPGGAAPGAEEPAGAGARAAVDSRGPGGGPDGSAHDAPVPPSAAAAGSPRGQGPVTGVGATAAAVAEDQRTLVSREAARRRSEEAAGRGLEIVAARYGDPAHVAEGPDGAQAVLDVTDCLMVKVRRSQLCISEAPKSSLLGFYDPCAGEPGRRPVLYICYRFGGVEHRRTFGDTEAVWLP